MLQLLMISYHMTELYLSIYEQICPSVIVILTLTMGNYEGELWMHSVMAL